MNRKSILQAAALAIFALVTTHAWAANQPLNNPTGLALDSKGNLYVADAAANTVWVYNTSYV
jgi:DNA-binding beta-propeller fold protein YncE